MIFWEWSWNQYLPNQALWQPVIQPQLPPLQQHSDSTSWVHKPACNNVIAAVLTLLFLPRIERNVQFLLPLCSHTPALQEALGSGCHILLCLHSALSSCHGHYQWQLLPWQFYAPIETGIESHHLLFFNYSWCKMSLLFTAVRNGPKASGKVFSYGTTQPIPTADILIMAQVLKKHWATIIHKTVLHV